MVGLFLCLPKSEETKPEPVSCSRPMGTVALSLMVGQQPASRVGGWSTQSLSPCWEKAVGSSHAWACGERCSPEVWEQGPALPGLRAALPASGLESPVWVLGSSGVRMKKRDAGGSGAVGYGVVFSFQAPITGLLRGVHLFSRSPPTHARGPSTAAFPEVGDALSSPALALLWGTPMQPRSFGVSIHLAHVKTHATPHAKGRSALRPW